MFHNGSRYGYKLIIKKLAKKLKGQFELFGEDTKKYITFLVPIDREIKVYDKKGGEIIDKKIALKLKFIDSVKFIRDLFWRHLSIVIYNQIFYTIFVFTNSFYKVRKKSQGTLYVM